MLNSYKILEEELKKAITPVSGKNIACLIETKKGQYMGHNVEKEDPLILFHAEDMALDNMLDNETTPSILKVITAGSGKAIDLKNSTPCFNCFQRMSRFFNEDTVIEVVLPNEKEKVVSFSPQDFYDAYSPKTETYIEGDSHEEIVNNLKKSTILKGVDLDIIADIKLLGIEEDISFILIGSTAGKGGTSQITINRTNRDYSDIDLLAVTEKDSSYVEEKVLDIVNRYYSSCDLTRKECPLPSKQTTRLKRKIKCEDGEKIRLIDLDIGKKIEDIIHIPEYIKFNWFHYLSK